MAAHRGAVEAHARTKLAGFKVPKEWSLVETLPRNAAGKLLKRNLRRDKATSGH